MITGISVSPDVVGPGKVVTLAAQVVDPDGDGLRYAWTFPDGWILDGRSDAPALTLRAPAVTSSEAAAVMLTVSDGAGRLATQVALVRTTSPGASTGPAITFRALAAQPNPVAPGGTIDVAAMADSADGAGVTFRADVSDPAWTVRAGSSGARVTAPLAYDRSATVTLFADGATGGRALGRVLVATRPSTAPAIDALVASPAVTAPAGRVQLSAAVRDANGLALTFAWSISGPGWAIEPQGATATATAPAVPSAPATVTLTVTDAAGASASSSVSVSTSAAVPVLDLLTAAPAPVAPGGIVTAAAAARDPTGAAVTYAWSVAPSEWTLAASGATASAHAPLRYDAVGILTVTASGPFAATEGRVLVSTTPPTPPAIDALVASPAVARPGGQVVLSASARGAGGLDVTYAWSIAGPGWTIAASGPNATATAPAVPDAPANVTVTVTDAAGAGASSTAALSTSGAVPVLDAVDVQPVPAAPGGTVAATAAARDPAGGTIAFAWSIAPPEWTLTSAAASASIRAPLRYGAVGVLTVTATGRFASTTAQRIVSTIASTPPDITSLVAAPAEVAPGGTVLVAATAASGDGLPLAYAWSVAGAGWAIAGNGGDAVVTAPASPGATAIVAVDVTDAAGATARAAVPISTTP